MKKIFTLAAVCALAGASASAKLVAHFPMEVNNDQITEVVSGSKFDVQGLFTPENLPGAVGQALRFDGYTSRVNARLGDIIPAGTKQMTVSLWVAVPCYPIIQIDTDTSEKTAIVTSYNETSKSGFGFYLGFNGKYSFKAYVGGWPLSIDVDTPLPTYKWNNLVAVLDADAKTATLYNNGAVVGSTRLAAAVQFGAADFYMGQSTASRKSGPFELMSYNGLIDDVKIWDEAIPATTIASWQPENPANLDIPSSRFADQLLRPRFHGMPASSWTNESHGMVYADGRYHVFFQKNADGPYMARLHWGHISSENLYDWREEPIALAPGASYDIKGCWSGCVFTDAVVTGGKPNIIYTAVDYAKASIAQAAPTSDDLITWDKLSRNPIIKQKPTGLSDDFRDPYFFRNGDNAYIVVGSSKGGIGTTTLHKYNATTGLWSNDGTLFYTGPNVMMSGSFWEMPTVTPMSNGRWLFTVTPLGTSLGVRTLYWTGSIDTNGQFTPATGFSTPKQVELISREGFGLLSPTIYQHDGKTIVLGIVPDKLASSINYQLGWAHCYSLPREWSLAADGTLVQKPFSGLSGMRSATKFAKGAYSLNGTEALGEVSGREAEILATFEVGDNPFGFNIFKNAAGAATITYMPATGELKVDFTGVSRYTNDQGVYDGVYRCTLPVRPAKGTDIKFNIFIDHSILDIFINDTYATSIRVFPTAADADGIEVFATSGAVNVKSLNAWKVDVDSFGGFDDVFFDDVDANAPVDVYDLTGSLVRAQVNREDATADLPAGIYLVGREKVVVR